MDDELSQGPRLETRAVRAGAGVDSQTGAVVEPITLSATFERDPDTPTAATAAVLAVLCTVGAGGHVLLPDDVYQGTVRLLRQSLSRWGVRFSTVDMTEPAAVRAAIEPETRLVWAEGLSNPLLKVTDVARVAAIAHQHGARFAVDNTIVTPLFQQPLSAGADFVVHSTTKYLAGHADVVAGILVLSDASLLDDLRTLQWIEGAVPGPFDCWLTARGLKTLAVRMHAHADHAAVIAAFLEEHPAVAWVRYPGLASHPQHELAAEVLSGFGGIVSFGVRGGADAATTVAASTRLFINATSVGAPESLIQHIATAPTYGPGTDVPDELLRLSAGLEHPDDLIADLDRALDVLDPVA